MFEKKRFINYIYIMVHALYILSLIKFEGHDEEL